MPRAAISPFGVVVSSLLAGPSVIAVDAVSGEKRWRFKTAGEVISAPAVVDGTVYVTARDGPLYAVDAKTGQERWHYERAFGSPVVSEGLACVGGWMKDDKSFYGESPYLGGVDTATGGERWRVATTSGVWVPSSAGGILYFGTAGPSRPGGSPPKTGYLRAVDLETGKELWSWPVPESSGFSSVAVSAGVLYFGSSGNLYAVR